MNNRKSHLIEAIRRNAERERRETVTTVLLCALLIVASGMAIIFHIR